MFRLTLTLAVIGSCYAINQDSIATMRWAAPSLDRSSNLVPSVMVAFKDGTSGLINLERYNAVDMGDSAVDACTFMGSLAGKPDSVAAVTGCPQDSSFHVSLSTDQGVFKAKVSNIDGSVSSTKSSKIDNIVDRSPFKKIELEDRQKTVLPESGEQFYFRLVLGYTQTFLDTFKGNRDNLKVYLGKILVHNQVMYYDKSFKHRITFDTPAPILDLTPYKLPIPQAEAKFIDPTYKISEKILKDNGNANHLAIWVTDNVVPKDTTAGIADSDAICIRELTKSMVSINEYDKDALVAASIMSHEIGHNMGFAHDNEKLGCNGIMAAFTNGIYTWSKCSVKNFREQFARAVKAEGSFCLYRDPPTKDKGTWAPWSRASSCNKMCGGGTKTRTRLCIGFNCDGSATGTLPCNTQKCKACVNKAGDAECNELKSLGYCADIADMKKKCSKACNVDTLSASECLKYKGEGDCKPSSNNYGYMAENCAKTCGVFCS